MKRFSAFSILIAALIVPFAALSQTINIIEAIKIKNGYHGETLYYYHHNWQVLRQRALRRGYIHSYELVEVDNSQHSAFDLLLVTRYVDQDQLDVSEKHFDRLIAEHGKIALLNDLKPADFRERVFSKKTKAIHGYASNNAHPIKEIIMEGLDNPWSMAFISESEALVTEKDGDLLRVNLHTKQKNLIKNFPKDLAKAVTIDASQYATGIYPASMTGIKSHFNMAMFDVVLDPDFAANQYVYLAYASKQRDAYTTKVIRARLRGNGLYEIKTILLADPYTPGGYHFGGGLTFGQDGKLYVTFGERLFNELNQPAMPIAQDLNDKRGKIHRINSDGSIPEDNPVLANNQKTSIYAIGIRASQGITVDPNTGKLWFTEHGTHQGDELNLLKPRANYGWPIKTTGKYRYSDYKPPSLEERTFTQPKWFWKHTVAPTGLTFYTGDEFPEWKHNLFISGLSVGSLWRVSIVDDIVKSAEELFVDERVRSRKVVQSPAGKLYMLTDENNGKIIRIRNSKP